MDQRRTTLYALALVVAFANYAAAAGTGRGLGFWVVAGLGVAATAYGLAGPGAAARSTALRIGATLLGGVALVVPISLEWATGLGDLRDLIAEHGILAPILVLVFASRTLAADTDARFAAFWSDPLGRPAGAVSVQSTLAAVFLGAAMALAFQAAVPSLAAGRGGGPTGVVFAALAGTSPIHQAILFLFFVTLAEALEQGRLHLADRTALAALRRSARDAAGSGLAARIDAELALRPESAVLHRARDLVTGRTAIRPTAGPDGFRRAARLYLRGLVPFLPLLGFLGTVIGLSVAMAELPRGLGGPGGQADVAASLAGLAVKFETTLLGILGSMIVSALIAVIERREAEIAAEVDRMIEAARPGGGP